MARISFTLRIDAEERAALESLSKIEGRSVIPLVNEAIKSFLIRRDPRERTLEANLTRLRAYREGDLGFQRAVREFVESEATLDDPAEGQLVNGDFEPIGPAQGRIRDLLGS